LKKSLYHQFHNISHAADYADAAVRVFRQASFIGGKLYDPLWKPGYEKSFTVHIQPEDAATVLPEKALYHTSCQPNYEQWLTMQSQAKDKSVDLPANVSVINAGTVKVLSGVFDNCLKVDLTCQKPENVEYLYKDQHLLHQSPFDVCGKKSIYYAPGIGIIKAEYDWDGALYTVELSEYVSMAVNDEYMPVCYGNSWLYKVTNEPLQAKNESNKNKPLKITLKYTVSFPPEGSSDVFMLFEEYQRIEESPKSEDEN
jgi:hypothetical protein